MPPARRPQRRCTLVAPPDQSVGQSLNFLGHDAPRTTQTRSIRSPSVSIARSCHSSRRIPPPQQAPYFADPNITTAYQAAIPKIDFTGCLPQNSATFATTCGMNSRFYQRLAIDKHNCWSDCAPDAALMLAQIQAFAQDADPDQPRSGPRRQQGADADPGHGRERRQPLRCRHHRQVRVLRPAPATIAYDTSGIDPAADLTSPATVTWAGGWGVNPRRAAARRRRPVQASSSSTRSIQATGEFSIEAWVAPRWSRPTTVVHGQLFGRRHLAQLHLGADQPGLRLHAAQLELPGLNGMPQLQTPDAAMALQASLQHVVLTYDPVNGRQIYVNGVNQNVPTRRRAAPSRTGTPPSPWYSAAKSRATMPSRA